MTDQTSPSGGASVAGSEPAAATSAAQTPAAEQATSTDQAASAPGGGVLAALLAHPLAFLSLLKNRPLEALRLGHAQGNAWWLQFGLYVVVLALYTTVLLDRSEQVGMGMLSELMGMRSFGLYSSSYGDYWMLAADEGFGLFFMALVLYAVFVLLRVALLHVVFALDKAGVPFSASGQIVMTAYSGHLCALLLGTLLLLVPGAGLGGLVLTVGSLVMVLLSLLSEIVMYIGVNRRHRFAGSPLMPFVLGYGGWLLCVGLILYALVSAGMESL